MAVLPSPIACIGAGAMATALTRRLQSRGHRVAAVLSRRQAPAEALAAAVEAPVASTALADLPADVRLVLCCVPDQAVYPVAEALSQLPHPWPSCTVLHTAGALTSGVLAPVAEQGAGTLSFHPVQTFTAATPPSAFEGIRITLEGDPEAVAVGQALATELGGIPLTINPKARTQLHLAASMASNFFVTLQALAADVGAAAGLDRSEAQALLRPLVAHTWANLRDHTPEDALTGPIRRGDAETVARHLEALQADLPGLLPAYVVLATETVRVAVRSGSLSHAEAQALLNVLQRAIGPADPLP